MANRRGTFLSDEMMKKNCIEYTAYPVNFASEYDAGNLLNSKLRGIKPPRKQRIAARPSSIDVYAVAKSKMVNPNNPSLAANGIADLERTKIIQERIRPVKDFKILTAFEQMDLYGDVAEQVYQNLGITAAEARNAFEVFSAENVALQQRIQAELDSLNRSIVVPAMTQEKTATDQMLEQLKGVRNEVENLRIEIDRRAVDDTLRQRVEAKRADLQSATKPQLIAILEQNIEIRRNAGLPQLTGARILTPSQRQQSRKDQILNEIMLYFSDEQQTILENASVSAISAPIREFKRQYEGISTEDKRDIIDDMVAQIIVNESLSSIEQVRQLLGSLDIDKLVDYFKNNRLALPNIGQSVAPIEVGVSSEPQSSSVVPEPEDPSIPPQGAQPPPLTRDPGTGDVLM